MKWIVVVVVLLLISCTNSKQHEVGQFVYVDCFGSIHVDRDCASKLTDNPKTKEERMANIKGVTFVDTCNLLKVNYYSNITPIYYSFCPRCVDDDAYRHLSAIMERNKTD